jgi:hypothetical protein
LDFWDFSGTFLGHFVLYLAMALVVWATTSKPFSQDEKSSAGGVHPSRVDF